MARSLIDRQVFVAEKYDIEWSKIPTNLGNFIEWLGELFQAIPAAYRPFATVEIDSVSSYEGGSLASIEIKYRSPETDEEIMARKRWITERDAKDEAEDRAVFAALKKQYGWE